MCESLYNPPSFLQPLVFHSVDNFLLCEEGFQFDIVTLLLFVLLSFVTLISYPEITIPKTIPRQFLLYVFLGSSIISISHLRFWYLSSKHLWVIRESPVLFFIWLSCYPAIINLYFIIYAISGLLFKTLVSCRFVSALLILFKLLMFLFLCQVKVLS